MKKGQGDMSTSARPLVPGKPNQTGPSPPAHRPPGGVMSPVPLPSVWNLSLLSRPSASPQVHSSCPLSGTRRPHSGLMAPSLYLHPRPSQAPLCTPLLTTSPCPGDTGTSLKLSPPLCTALHPVPTLSVPEQSSGLLTWLTLPPFRFQLSSPFCRGAFATLQHSALDTRSEGYFMSLFRT